MAYPSGYSYRCKRYDGAWGEVVQVSMRPSWPARLWRVRPWNSSPLMRVSDRAEVVLRALAVVVVAAAVPVAGAVGTVSYTGAEARIVAQDSGKVRVVATETADAVRVPDSDRYATHQVRYQAPVQWDNGGKIATATVDVPGPQVAGATVTLWTKNGQPTVAPSRPGSAAAEGIGTGLAILVETWCAAAATVWFTGTVLDARRYARWEREWRGINRPIGKDTL
ncbi:Rv1733c family protein [Nocardia sp. CA-136227]|uniref:Rv1733c family protein n=1 Tax=Nocardia sp. CA-136227 TaxID=3239979 RepID=UPI003D967C44